LSSISMNFDLGVLSEMVDVPIGLEWDRENEVFVLFAHTASSVAELHLNCDEMQTLIIRAGDHMSKMRAHHKDDEKNGAASSEE
jgi:hypothetical protein